MTPAEIEAAIRNGEAEAYNRFGLLDGRGVLALRAVYADAAEDLHDLLAKYAGAGDRVQVAYLQMLLADIDKRLETLADAAANIVYDYIDEAALFGAAGVGQLLGEGQVGAVAGEAASYVHNLTAADGLGLSDRVWRIDAGARQAVSKAVQTAIIRGDGAADAAADFVARGVKVPMEIEMALQQAGVGNISRMAAKDLLVGPDADNPRGAFAKSLRVMRTEMVRAHAAAYERAASKVSGVVGFKLHYSPLHREDCKCRPFVEEDLHGLGVGVFPPGHVPLPIHPNSRTYATAVFGDEA